MTVFNLTNKAHLLNAWMTAKFKRNKRKIPFFLALNIVPALVLQSHAFLVPADEEEQNRMQLTNCVDSFCWGVHSSWDEILLEEEFNSVSHYSCPKWLPVVSLTHVLVLKV